MSWLTNGLAAVQSLNSKKTYEEWIENLICLITPPEAAECLLVFIVNDTCQELRTKDNTGGQRGKDNIKAVIEGFE